MKSFSFKFLIVAIAATSLSICFAAPPKSLGAVKGIPWTGRPALKESVAKIMARQQIVLPPHTIKNEEEGEGSDRDSLPQNPASPLISSYPEITGAADALVNPTKPHLGPQFSLSTNWLGSTLGDSGLVPPDTMGDVSPTQVVLAVNGRIRVFDKSGNLGALNTTTDAFFASVRGAGTSDPRVRFDRLSQRWYFVIIDVTSANNRILIAVSNSATIDASSVFSFFFFNYASPLPAPVTPETATSFCDYPTLGIDANALYIGGNIFASSFAGNDVFVIRKSTVLSGGPLVVTAFRGIALGNGAGPFTPHGVDNDDPVATEGYVLGVDNATFGTLQLRIISTPGGTPSISANIPITVPATAFPLAAPQTGTIAKIDSLEDRLFAAKMFRNRITGVQTIWTAHNIGVNSAGVATAATRTGSRWYQLQGFQTGNTPSLIQSGTVFDSAATNPNFFSIPSIAMNGQGHAAIGFTRAGLGTNPNAFFAFRNATDGLGTTQAPIAITTNTNTYAVQGNGTNRWGDYSHTMVDPADGMTLWTFQEYCNATNSYAIRIAKLLAPAPGAISLSAASGFPGDTVNITVTGSGIFDGGSTFPQRLTAAMSGSGVVVNSVTFVPNTPPTDPQVVVNVTVQPGAAPGARTLTVTNPDGQSSPGATFTVNQATISGHVTLNNWVGPITTPQIVVEVKDAGNNVIQSVTTNLDASGNFSFTPTFVGGTYTVTAKGTFRFLRQALTSVAVANSGVSGLSFSLLNGDVNGDNIVGAADLASVKSLFGQSSTAPVDLNGDGLVGAADLAIVKSNFGKTGD
jgi:hypothetical protein